MSKHRTPVREYIDTPSPFYTGVVIAAGAAILLAAVIAILLAV